MWDIEPQRDHLHDTIGTFLEKKKTGLGDLPKSCVAMVLMNLDSYDICRLAKLNKAIHRGDFRCPKFMSPGLKNLLGRLLDTNPDTRITIQEKIDDPWFKKGMRSTRKMKM
ncbi:CBL-interacting protein kinase 19, partial [Bienertia sinuspersici]